MEGWGEFYVGEVGAAAALAGLLFVAISINIEKILAVATLPARAAQTLLIVTSALVIVYAVLLCSGAVQVATLRHFRAAEGPLVWLVVPTSVLVLVTVPGVVGAILLITGNSVGAYWIGVDNILALLGTLLGGWVMLVEILR